MGAWLAGRAAGIGRALGTAGLGPGQLGYVEAHGTGTQIGDPVEANAMGEAIGKFRHRPLTVGAVKTNIGHAGSAAGIAGLLKTVLAIENSAIPASLNYSGPAAGIDLEGLGLRVNAALAPWPAGEGPRRAGVSSFGMGGTNAHMIVEEAPAHPISPNTERDDGP